MTDPNSERETWATKLGFLLAAAGSAIGLGNIWRFPTVAGESGGAAFVLIYIAAVIAIGIPVMLAELVIGWQTRSNPVRAFVDLSDRKIWRFIGVIAVIASLAILSYYSVIAAWTLAYVPITFSGVFNESANPELLSQRFATVTESPYYSLVAYVVFMLVTMLVVLGGIRSGIEKWSKVLMPMLLAILILLVIRAVTLPGAAKGLSFFLKPDFSKVTTETVLNAVSQAFFSLSLGMGIMITYGSYLSKDEDIQSSAVMIAAIDTSIAVMAGLVIFPALFTIPGLEPAEGPKLIFLVLPRVFEQIPAGIFFGTGFFLLLTIAALTSAISLMEVVVTYLIEQWQLRRKTAVLISGSAAMLLGIPTALSVGAVPLLSDLPILHCSVLDLLDTLFGKLCLTFVSLAICLFVGWTWGTDKALSGLESDGRNHWLQKCWSFAVRYICPVVITLILLSLVL